MTEMNVRLHEHSHISKSSVNCGEFLYHMNGKKLAKKDSAACS
jgi:hypothetical protein